MGMGSGLVSVSPRTSSASRSAAWRIHGLEPRPCHTSCLVGDWIRVRVGVRVGVRVRVRVGVGVGVRAKVRGWG